VLCASVRAFAWLSRLWSAWRRQSRPTFACSRFPSVHQSFRHDKWEVGDRRIEPEVQQPLAGNWRYRRQRQRLSRLRRGCVLNAVRLGSGGGDGGSSLVIGQAKSDRWSQAWASSNDSKRPLLDIRYPTLRSRPAAPADAPRWSSAYFNTLRLICASSTE
jgi:hypothetical protein